MNSYYKSGIITLCSQKRPNTHEWQGNCVKVGLELFYWLLWLNPWKQGEHLTSQLSQVAAWVLVTRVCPVYLVDELVLVFLVLLKEWGRCVCVNQGWLKGNRLLGRVGFRILSSIYDGAPLRKQPMASTSWIL